MLGGFGHLDAIEVESSKQFLGQLMSAERRANGRALDCGSGIGRVTKNFLLPMGFKEIDMLDFSQEFLDRSAEFIGPGSERVINKYCASMQTFGFEDGLRLWDVIWIQVCLAARIDIIDIID